MEMMKAWTTSDNCKGKTVQLFSIMMVENAFQETMYYILLRFVIIENEVENYRFVRKKRKD